MIAEVEVDRASGMVRVPRVWAAVDAGQIINPDGLTNQIEGGIVQSASWTLNEQVRFDRNGILSRDWASYPILTMPDVPKVEIELINRPGRARRRRRRRLAGTDGRGDRQRVRARDRQAAARPAVPPGRVKAALGSRARWRSASEHAKTARCDQ